jgi:tRNA(His) 5'-end guanylyltransferase
MTDFDDIKTMPWWDGIVQKICSNSASIVTETFNKEFYIWLLAASMNSLEFDELLGLVKLSDVIKLIKKNKGARFDSRVFTIPSPTDVINYLVWRQGDATRNSISSVAQSLYPHSSRSQLNGKNSKQQQEMIFQKGQNWDKIPTGLKRGRAIVKVDGKWVVVDPPIFSQEWEYLTKIIPNYK